MFHTQYPTATRRPTADRIGGAATAIRKWWNSEPPPNSFLARWIEERERSEAFRRRKQIERLTALDFPDPVRDGGEGAA